MMAEQVIYTNELLDRKRKAGDPEADLFIARIFADTTRKSQLQQWLGGKHEYLSELQDNYSDIRFIKAAKELPAWADPKLMKTGSAFFARHAEIIMSLLGLLSLPYCYAGANGSMVLYLSELIRKQTTKRLYDTAVFVWEVMAPGGFDKNGNAFEEILKVRIMHAAIRYYTLQSGKWNDAWGTPINQEDMAGTNLSFSLIVIRGLRMLGFNIGRADQAAFMHLWAVIGYLTGLDYELIPENSKQAQLLDATIKQRQFRSSEHGKELASSLTEHILKVNKTKATAKDILGLMRYLLGNEISDMINIDAAELPPYKLGIIRTVNLVKSLIPQGDPGQLYRSAYATFKAQGLELRKLN